MALAAVRDTLPSGAKVMELGYQSSECRGTIALTPETPEGLPPFHHHYFEFVEAGAWDRGAPDFVGLADLEQGKRYYVLFTTVAGLYRYFINDLVEVCGFLNRTPLLRFVQKGKGRDQPHRRKALRGPDHSGRDRGLHPPPAGAALLRDGGRRAHLVVHAVCRSA